MGTEIANLDAFKAGPAAALRAAIPQQDDRMGDGIGQSYGIIGYKGKVWSLRINGENRMFIRPDDGSPLSYIDVVILDSAGEKSRSYFKDFVEGTSEPPLCSSANGVVPDAGVPHKQSDTCALCPRNVWQTNDQGRKSRDCSEFKRLAVLLAPNLTKPLLGDALMEAVFLRVPAGSLTNLLNLHKSMHDGLGYHSWEYVTRIDFDPTQAFPKMRFTATEPMPASSGAMLAKLKIDPQVKRILSEDVARTAIAGPKTVIAHEVTGAVTQQPQMIEVTANPTPAPPLSTPLPSGFAQDAAPAPPSSPLSGATGSPSSESVPSGFGDATPATPSLSEAAGTQAQPTAGAVADTGEPQEVDAAMDALIAKLTAPKTAA